jgi:predicted Zn-dependent peptidase
MKNHRIKLYLVAALALVMASLPSTAQVKNYKDIKYPKLPEFKIQQPEVYDLDNGMKIFLIEDHELPLISVSARIRTGSNYEPADKTGLGDIFGQTLREGGTESMSGDEIDEFLEARAAFIETGMSGDQGSASMNCLEEDFDDVFELFGEILRNPVFDQSKIDLAKRQTRAGIARRNDQVGAIVGREFGRLMYGPDSPMSRMTEYATLANIERADLMAWHEKYYHPNNIYLGVSGDFDSEQMKKKIQAAFGSWERGPAFDESDVAYEKPKPGTYFIEKDDVTQANVRLGHLGIETKNPDFFAVQVMNEVLGGGFAGRLFSNVRSEKGLAYSVFGGVGSSFLRPGVFQVGLSTKSETMGESVDALKEEINGIIDNPPSAEEMDRAKESILNSFVFNYTSVGQILAQQMTYAYYGLPADFLEKYRANIEKVTGEDVARVAKKYVHPDALTLLVVGKSADFDRQMDSFGEVTTLDITIPPPPDTTPELVKNAATLEAGSKIFARAANKIAGAGMKIKSMSADMTRSMKMGGNSIPLGESVTVELPDKLNVKRTLPMGEQKIIINGDQGKVMMGTQQQDLPAAMVKEQVQELSRDLLFLANSLGAEGLEAVAAGTEEMDGVTYDIVSVTFNGLESRLYVAPDGTVAKQVYQGKHPVQQTPGTVEMLFSDYREVDGRTYPFKRVMNFEGEEVLSTSVDKVSFNPEVEAGMFEMPASD